MDEIDNNPAGEAENNIVDQNDPGVETASLEVQPPEAGKVKTGRIPKPAPRDVDTSLTSMDEPLSADTISMKRPVPKKKVVLLEEKKLKIFCYNCEQKLDLSDMEPFSKIECPSCSNEIIVPRWFDNYLLEEACGEGGMAKVYRGLDLALDREIAVKILNADIAGEAERGKMFLHEARTAATLNHFALLPIYTCGQFDNQPYIVMQFMAGGSLDKELDDLAEDDLIPIGKATKWMLDAAEGLDNARRHGIVHHDIKPGNFMLDADGALKVGDFGISQALHDSRSEEIAELTKLWVSPDYVSPEKVSTGKETYLGDIYSLGATFYHILTKQPPFDNDVVEELLKAKTVKDPVDIRKLRDDIPDGLASLIMSMLARTPEARPSYRDVIAELNALKKVGAKKRKSSASPKEKPSMLSTKISAKKMRKPSRTLHTGKKSNSLALVAGVVILIALIGGGYYLWANGLFSGASAQKNGASDYLPDVSQQLAEGNPKTASMLAEEALDSVGLELEGKKQAALQLAFATYLNKDHQASSKCSIITDRLISSGVERDDPVMAVLRYLSAGQIDPSNLRDQLTGENELKLISNIAILLKEAYNKGSDAEIRAAYRNFSSDSSGISDKFWGNKSFSSRIHVWNNWILMGKGNVSSLEPLIAGMHTKKTPLRPKTTSVKRPTHKPAAPKHSTTPIAVQERKHDSSLSLSALNAEWLAKHRKFVGSRPKPKNYTFSDSAIQAYLSKLSKKNARSESNRANQITPMKAHLCGMMLHMPYGQTSIQRRRGGPLSGKIMANHKYISVKLRSGKRMRLMWGDLHFNQFIKFLAHYAKLRGEADAGETVDKAKQKRETAWGYLRIAILCDWYGKYRDAVRYTRKAVSIDKGIENEAIIYMME